MSSATIRERVRRVVQDTDTPTGRFFDLTIQCLIVLSLITFSLETLPDLSPMAVSFLAWFEISSVIIFSIEYLLRVWVSDKPLRFMLSFQGLVDLGAVLPFYLRTGIDLRSIRVVRLLRLFRAFKLLRYSRALTRLKASFMAIKEELVLFTVIAALLLYISSVGIYYCEREAQPETFASIFHSMWWATVTLTTVGYGDIVPVTLGGKIFTGIILFLGLAIVAIPSGLMASSLTSTLRQVTDAEKPDGDERAPGEN